MSSPTQSSWQDRRALFQRGKEVHEPGRRASGFSGNMGIGDVLSKVTSNESVSSAASPTSPTERRRSSISPSSPTSGGMFASLTGVKRGSQDYGTRRTSMSEQAVGGGGVLSGWYSSTFKGSAGAGEQQGGGMQAKTGMQQGGGEIKRGIME